VLSKGTTVLKGESLLLNMDTGRAEIDPALLRIPRSEMMTHTSAKQADSKPLTVPESDMNLTATKLVRINDNEFIATISELTSCDMPEPSWKFGAKNLDVDLQGYATGRHVIFYIKDIPVLYLPWMAFPVAMEKRSGILIPHAGHSKSRGMQLDIPVYWVISPSQDLQLDLDIMSRRGVGTGVDYRYIRKRGSEGHISAYSIFDRVEDRWRWQLAEEHKEIFSNSANLRMSVNTTGDRKFLADFGEKSGDYNRQSSDTTINTLKTWQNYAATSYLHYNENLYAADNKATVQTLPSIGMAAVRQPIFTMPLYFDFDGSADNLYRETAPAGQRLYLFPRITLFPFQTKYLQASLFIGTHIRGYATERRPSGSDTQTTDGDIIPEAGIRLSSSLMRIYETNTLTLKKIRHEIIPEIGYSFVSERNQERLPFYDYADRMIQKNMISLSVTSLINGKFVSGATTEYRDISRIKLGVDYKSDGDRRDLLTLVENQRPWSDLKLESETLLSKQMKITFDTRYNLYGKNLSTAVAGFEFDDRLGNSIGAAYQMARSEVEYFEGRFATKLFKPLELSYTARYSFDRGDFLESVYAAEYRHKCWSVHLAVHQRPGNQSYTVNFNLAGLTGK
jgi:LPS-assembly protein